LPQTDELIFFGFMQNAISNGRVDYFTKRMRANNSQLKQECNFY